MELSFKKYQGAGNDFIMIDNRTNAFDKHNTKLVSRLCDRRFGIGADGLILLENDKNADFAMVYYNADGNQSTMCGNGGRCLVAFAKTLGLITSRTAFMAIDGRHDAVILEDDRVSLKMIDVDKVNIRPDYTFLDTGSPHHVVVISGLEGCDVKSEGAKIRYSDLYGEKGANVNFVAKVSDDFFAVRTYERGVEDETLSCGTGVTAVAIAMHATGQTENRHVKLHTPGGMLEVWFDVVDGRYVNVWLNGPAEEVFSGIIHI